MLRLICFTTVTSAPEGKNCDNLDATHAFVQPLSSRGKAQVIVLAVMVMVMVMVMMMMMMIMFSLPIRYTHASGHAHYN